MRKLQFLALVLGLASFAAFGAAGCKNACEKAEDHINACAEEYCEDHPDNTMCQHLEEEGVDAIPGAEECNEEAQALSQEWLDKDCSEFYVLFEMGE